MKLARYEQVTGLAVVFLAAYAWPILEPDLSNATAGLLGAVALAVWLTFGLDYLIRLYLARAKLAFVRGGRVGLGAPLRAREWGLGL